MLLTLSLLLSPVRAAPDSEAGASAEVAAPACTSDSSLPLSAIAPGDIPGLIAQARGCVLVFELYASWCGPCVQLAPAIAALGERYADRGVLIRGLSVDTDRKRLEAFHAEHGAPFAPVVVEGWTLAGLTEVFAGLGVDFEEAVPLLLVFDREGTLRYQASEPADLAGVEDAVRGLL